MSAQELKDLQERLLAAENRASEEEAKRKQAEQKLFARSGVSPEAPTPLAPKDVKTNEPQTASIGAPIETSPIGLQPKTMQQAKGTHSPAVDSRGRIPAVFVVGAFFVITAMADPANPDSFLPWTLNPTGRLFASKYIIFFLLSILGKELANMVLRFWIETVLGAERMDIDKDDAVKTHRLEVLQTVDLCYLALNTIVEFIGFNHLAAFMIDGPVTYRVAEFSIVNGLIAFVVVLCLNDILYYPVQYVAHSKYLYPHCHKHHHRQLVPFRGYADASNQHPLEQIFCFSIFLASMHLAAMSVGLHIGAAIFATMSWALLNISNHLAFNSQMHLPLPFPAYPRDHQMHHRNPKCNYSMLTSMCDRAFGTFAPYKPLSERAPEVVKKMWYENSSPYDATVAPEKEADEDALTSGFGRPEFLPSPYSIAGSGLGVMISACACAAMSEDGFRPPQMVAFVRSAILVVNLAVISGATEQGPPPEWSCVSKRVHVPKYHDLKEAVPDGHVKKFRGGKNEWKNEDEETFSSTKNSLRSRATRRGDGSSS